MIYFAPAAAVSTFSVFGAPYACRSYGARMSGLPGAKQPAYVVTAPAVNILDEYGPPRNALERSRDKAIANGS